MIIILTGSYIYEYVFRCIYFSGYFTKKDYKKIDVDIEYIRPYFADEQIVERFFSKQEADKFLSLPKRNM